MTLRVKLLSNRILLCYLSNERKSNLKEFNGLCFPNKPGLLVSQKIKKINELIKIQLMKCRGGSRNLYNNLEFVFLSHIHWSLNCL